MSEKKEHTINDVISAATKWIIDILNNKNSYTDASEQAKALLEYARVLSTLNKEEIWKI